MAPVKAFDATPRRRLCLGMFACMLIIAVALNLNNAAKFQFIVSKQLGHYGDESVKPNNTDGHGHNSQAEDTDPTQRRSPSQAAERGNSKSPSRKSSLSHNIVMNTSGINADFERIMSVVTALWVVEVPLLHHDQLLRAVATSPHISHKTPNATNATTAPPQLRDSYHTKHTLGLYRLAKVISDLEAGKKKHIQILVIGGSMMAGHEAGNYPGAWPRKLEVLLQILWGPESITVTNIARPGVDYNYWRQNFASIVEFGHFDIIIGDFAVNII
jgi:hypothetical protein